MALIRSLFSDGPQPPPEREAAGLTEAARQIAPEQVMRGVEEVGRREAAQLIQGWADWREKSTHKDDTYAR